MNARDLLRQAQIDRPEQTRSAEDAERASGVQILDVTPKANTADGVIVTTPNGGELTVINGAAGFAPETNGQSYQIQLSGGSARLVANSKPQATTDAAQQILPIVATRAPTETDAGQRGQLWLDISPGGAAGQQQANAWAYISQLGAYALISAAAAAIQSGNGPPTTEYEGTPASQAQYYDLDVSRYWTYNVDTWRPDSFLSLLALPPATVTDSLVIGDRLAIDKYEWVWNGIDWQSISCCDNAPEAPPSGGCPEGWTWGPGYPEAPEGEFCTPANGWTCGPPPNGICPAT